MAERKKNPYRRIVRIAEVTAWTIFGVIVSVLLVAAHVSLWRECGAWALLLIPGVLGGGFIIAGGFVWIEQRWKRAEHEWDERKRGVSS